MSNESRQVLQIIPQLHENKAIYIYERERASHNTFESFLTYIMEKEKSFKEKERLKMESSDSKIGRVISQRHGQERLKTNKEK